MFSPYPVYDPVLYREPLLSMRTTYGPSFEAMLSRGAGRPVMMQEFGASNSQFSPTTVGHYYRTLLYSSLGSGVQSFLAWCFTDASPRIFNRAPYIRCPHETQFGITDHEGNIKPAGKEIEQFLKVIKHIDFEQVEPASPEAGIIIPHEWAHGPDYSQYNLPMDEPSYYVATDILSGEKDSFGNQFAVKSWLSTFILSRQAGITVSFPRELSDWSKLRLILAPVPSTISPNPICHLYTTFWQRAKPCIEAGAVLYASLCAKSAISLPEVVELFGALIVDRATWQPVIQINLIEDFYDLKKGDVIEIRCPDELEGTGVQLEVNDGSVIAVDQDGKPALITKPVGLGHTVLCAYPLEYALGTSVNAFEKNNNVQRLYQSLKSLAKIEFIYSIDNPSLELCWLTGNRRDYVIVTNHSVDAIRTFVTASVSGKANYLSQEGVLSLPTDGQGFNIELAGYTGCIYEWEHAE